MTVIDLSTQKYKRDKVVVKCGDKEFVATPNDTTLDKIIKLGKKQMADGLKAGKKLDQIDFDNLQENEIDNAVDEAVNTVTVAKADYIKLADAIFGRGAGSTIYKFLGSSTVVMQEVMQDVVEQLYAQRKEQDKEAKKEYTSETERVD